MPTNEFFSENYAQARTKFLAAAQETGAVMHAYDHPSRRGPDGVTDGKGASNATIGCRLCR
jgi:hypothetical protein